MATDTGRERHRWWGGHGRPERLQVAAHRLVTAPVAERGDLGGQCGRVGVSGVEPLVQVGLERIEQTAAEARLDQ